jgi:hypothetical protein
MHQDDEGTLPSAFTIIASRQPDQNVAESLLTHVLHSSAALLVLVNAGPRNEIEMEDQYRMN